MIHPILLCGGSGTRLWPLSRKSYPKQFAKIMSEQSLFQASALRLSGDGFFDPTIVTGDPFRFIVTEQLSEVGLVPNSIIIEPEGKNTAPAILASALIIAKSDPGAVMLVAPSDHILPDTESFLTAVAAAVPRAVEGDLVTFGIKPTRAETGYGYLELANDGDILLDTPHSLRRFIEKPSSADATKMIATRNYLWNAGIFLFTAQTIISEFQRHAPSILKAVEDAVENANPDLGFTRLDATAWSQVDNISIDYAIMEKSNRLSVMPYSGRWSDLGGWDAIWLEAPHDADGNVCSDDVTVIDCSNSLLRSETDGLQLVGIGLDNIIAIAMGDAVLIADKSQAQKVKDAVSELKEKDAKQAVQLPRDYRPWGWYESLVTGGRFQVKRIVVNPGAALSLQSHHHRSEHWIVVEGTAKVTIDDTVELISENQSVYIPLGSVHRLENPGKVPMVLIEVQTGSYLGEDDIVRYHDVYERH